MRKKHTEKVLDPKRLGISRGAQNYFNEYINSIAFQRRVAEIRERFDIPARGLKKPDLQEVYDQKVMYSPSAWKHTGDAALLDKFRVALLGATKTFDLGIDTYWHTLFRVYVFHNKVPSGVFSFEFSGGFDLSHADYGLILNLQQLTWDHEDIQKNMNELYLALHTITESYPVAIFITKHTSQRRLREFIADKWPIIALQQMTSSSKGHEDGAIPHTRLKDGKYRALRERNAYILKLHKDGITPKKIRAMVMEKYKESLDSTYISTLINREKKIQQEV